jgi:hypothetical protein
MREARSDGRPEIEGVPSYPPGGGKTDSCNDVQKLQELWGKVFDGPETLSLCVSRLARGVRLLAPEDVVSESRFSLASKLFLGLVAECDYVVRASEQKLAICVSCLARAK